MCSAFECGTGPLAIMPSADQDTNSSRLNDGIEAVRIVVSCLRKLYRTIRGDLRPVRPAIFLLSQRRSCLFIKKSSHRVIERFPGPGEIKISSLFGPR